MVYELKATKTCIGRSIDENDIILDSQSVSKKHCEISFQLNGVASICDLHSMNGTFVNQTRIQNDEVCQ